MHSVEAKNSWESQSSDVPLEIWIKGFIYYYNFSPFFDVGYDFDNPISNNLQKFCLTFLEPSLTISGNVSSSSEQSESQRLGITGGAHHKPRFITIKLNFCNTELSYSVHTDLI